MSATLPAAVLAACGEVVVDGSADSLAPIVPEDRLGQMEDILIGAKNLVTLAAYVREERPFEDADIPQETFAGAVAAADRLLADAERVRFERRRVNDADGCCQGGGHGRDANVRQLTRV